jgi:hypothetical protein
MLTCDICKKLIENELDMVLLNADGDFACSKGCAEKYEKDKNYFFDVILPNNKLFAAWLGIPESSIG